MKQKDKKFIPAQSQISFVFASVCLITIYFNTQVYDAFNLPKLLILLISVAWLIGYLVETNPISQQNINFNIDKKIKILLSLYVLGIATSVLFAYDKKVAFFGESFRRNGALTYFGLLGFFIVLVRFIDVHNVRLFFRYVIFAALVLTTYSLIQITKNDWNHWSDPNSIFSTLGNTNFAGAVMAILFILIFGFLLFTRLNVFQQLFLLSLLLGLAFSIYKTNARQALLILIFGIISILIYKISFKRRKLAIILIGFSMFSILLTVLGVLDKGPLARLLYKDSVSVRGFYWRAGIEMFKNFPINGVGLDNYGLFFKEYREVNYPLRYGFNLTSSNAHNVFIQNFAVGGLILGLAYLFLQCFIFYVSIRYLVQTKSKDKKIYFLFFIAWISYQIQTLVSIENIGVAIWGWVLGGILLGLSKNSDEYSMPAKTKSNSFGIRRILASTVSTILIFLLVIPLYYLDRNVWLAKSYSNTTDQSYFKTSINYSQKVINSPFAITDYKNAMLINEFNLLDKSSVLLTAQKISDQNPRNLDTLTFLAFGYEQLMNYELAIQTRIRIAKYDPWNAQNYLGLAQLYRQIGNFEQMRFYANKILSFAGNDPIAEVTKKEFLNSQTK